MAGLGGTLKPGNLLTVAAAAAVMALALLPGAACDLAKMDENTPAFKFRNHHELLYQGQYDEAYAMFSSRLREEYYPTVDEFVADIEEEHYLVYYDIGIRETAYEGEEKATVSWNGSTVRNGKEFLMAGGAELVLENGQWMIDGVFADVAP